MKIKKPTKETALKILALLKHGLTRGLGEPVPGRMCVEAAVCYVMGLPHSDEPSCVSPVVRKFKIRLNDGPWSSNLSRAKGLARIAVAQLGSKDIDKRLFAQTVSRLTIQRVLPVAFRKIELEKEAVLCEQEPTEHSARIAADAAYAARAYAARAAADAARAAADAADAADAAYAADAAAYAADAAAYAAYAAYAADADHILTVAAEIGVEALQLCKSPGCKWLNLVK